MLSFKSNRLRAIDVPLPPSLQWLILTDNQIEALPSQLGERPSGENAPIQYCFDSH